MTGGIALVLAALFLVLIIAHAVLVAGVIVGRFGRWLFEQPEGVLGAAGRLGVVAVLLHEMGLL